MGYTTGAAVSALGMVLDVLCACLCVCVCLGVGSFPLIPFSLSTTSIVEGTEKMLVMRQVEE